MIETSQVLRISLDEAWKFLSDPSNLTTITPPSMGFKITSAVPPKIYPGLILTYRITPLLGLPMTWVSEITQVREPYFFVDRQLSGPYRYWDHEHELREVDGGVQMLDRVNFALPFWLAGTLMYHAVVKKQLAEIFSYRREVLERRFC